jgi:hypothetical protein
MLTRSSAVSASVPSTLATTDASVKLAWAECEAPSWAKQLESSVRMATPARVSPSCAGPCTTDVSSDERLICWARSSIRGSSDAHQGLFKGPSDAHQGLIKGSSDAHQGLIRGSSDAHQGLIRRSSRAHQRFIKGSSEAHQGLVRGSSEAHQGLIKGSSEVHQRLIKGSSEAHQRCSMEQ